MAITKKRAALHRRRLRKPRKKEAAKSIFKSKTAVVNFIIAAAGIVAAFHPATADFVKHHVAEILTAIGFTNVGLRIITHGRVALFDRAG